MSLPYKKILILGATSGIGLSMANRFITEYGCHVIAVGRRQDRIDDFIKAHSPASASGIQFDVSKLDEIPAFMKKVTEEHPDLDSVLVNSGIQRQISYLATEPERVDMKMIEEEFSINYLAPVAFTTAFLPFLKAKKGKETALM
jgi:short-subunit dehydrogenase involved in D-alanine esterification of teichoic acids